MKIQLNHSQQKFVFIISLTALYILLIFWLDFLQGPYWYDEKTFWRTTLTFSNSLFPSLEDLRDYTELNTPLPFIFFGALEYLFQKGIFAGRLLNLILSLVIVLLVGYPTRSKGTRAILCLIGLFLCPYYLWLSGRLYTEMIACFWVIIGFVSYIRNRHFISCIAFILAIASRQYMLAFPIAITTYEFIIAINNIQKFDKITDLFKWRWIAPLIAALSIFVWIYLFQGLVPKTALEVRLAPEVQRSTWALKPGGVINFLSFVGLYIVIPESILFRANLSFKLLNHHRRKITIIALALLIYFMIFPPLLSGSGNIAKIVDLLPYNTLKMLLFYSLSLLACVRFSQPNLISLIVMFNSLIMVKAYPWDRYVLPLVVVFWYLKSIRFQEPIKQEKQQEESMFRLSKHGL
ncbi:MAG: hypothetical protein AAFX46_05040 [Cyanobacteria bacterium J06636_27]